MKKKHSVLKILKPDKGHGVVVLDRELYNSCTLKIIGDKTKFKKLNGDITMLREGQLHRYLRKLKKTGLYTDDIYNNIYPTGSQHARIYGLPKMYKFSINDFYPCFRPIFSSISFYVNYFLLYDLFIAANILLRSAMKYSR